MAANPSLSPLRQDRFTPAMARHLIGRVGLGATPTEARALHALGLDGAVKRLVDYESIDVAGLPQPELDPDVIEPLTNEERETVRDARRSGDQTLIDEQRRMRLAAQAADRRMTRTLRDWWLDRMAATPRPAEDRLTLLWHGHFAASQRFVRDTWLMWRQHEMFRQNANGSFADLARGIVRDPAMIIYLNNDKNVKRQPNENLARELMELFTLGEGNYSEEDVKESARALTGHNVSDNDFDFRQRQHDEGRKTILGRSDDFDGDALAVHLLRQPACARFIALKLYDFFVADVGDVYRDVPREQRRMIDELAAVLRRNDYKLKPTLTTLFSSQHFYDASVVGRKIKDPVQLAVGSVRSMGLPPRENRARNQAMEAMGMVLFEPPTVNGWDGGRLWINTSTLFARQNYCAYLLTGVSAGKPVKMKRDFEPQLLLEGLDQPTPAQVVDHLADHLVGEHVTPERRAPLHAFMAERDKGVTHDSLVALLCLVTAMPEYQLC